MNNYKRIFVDENNQSLLGNYKTTFVNSSNYTINLTDQVVAVNYTTTGSVDITLPSTNTINQIVIVIIDTGGNAGINNITVLPSGSDTILGDTSLVINSDYNSIELTTIGNNWFLI